MRLFRKVLLCLFLALTSASGTPMRMENIDELMRALNESAGAQTLRVEHLNDDFRDDISPPDRKP